MLPNASPPASALISTAATKALPDESSSILDPVAWVIKVAAPVISRSPLSVMSLATAVALKVPPTSEVPRSRPEVSTTVALPVPVYKLTAPEKAWPLVLLRVMSPSPVVVKVETPLIVNASSLSPSSIISLSLVAPLLVTFSVAAVTLNS